MNTYSRSALRQGRFHKQSMAAIALRLLAGYSMPGDCGKHRARFRKSRLGAGKSLPTRQTADLTNGESRAGVVPFLAALLLGASTGLASAEPAKEHHFNFINVADSTQGFTDFQPFPAINHESAVAFVAARSDTGQGVFRSRKGKVTTISSEQEGLHNFGNAPAINARGVVAFSAATDSGSGAIFTGNGRSRRLIVDSIANGLFRPGVGSPSINAAGTVAFSSVRNEPGLPSSIFTGNGGALTTVFSTSGTDFLAFRNVAINDAGKIVFSGELADRSVGIFTVPGIPETIVDTNTRPEFFDFGDPVINNRGTIADVAFRFDGIEIITSKTGAMTPRNDLTNLAFTNAEHPSINNHGAVAFYAFPLFDPNDPTGIFLEVSGEQSLIPVIRPGDPLFGSTVSAVDLGRFALNDRFELTFQYALADGRTGIAIAAFHGEKEDDGHEE